MVESIAAEARERKAEQGDNLTQDHPLIRSGEDYAAFWNQHAAQATSPSGPVQIKLIASRSPVIGREHLPQVWQQASWHKVIEVFGLSVDDKRRSRDDEIWGKLPFTFEERSMHLSFSANIYKDFSSGKGGGNMQFCREMLPGQGREMTILEAAQWMIAEGISPATSQRGPGVIACEQKVQASGASAVLNTNRAIEVDLRPYLRSDHPE